MNKKEKIEQEIQKTLDQFQRAEKLVPNQYFYSRILQRLDERNEHKVFSFATMKPALLTVLVVVNVVTSYWYFASGELIAQNSTRQELIEVLVADLNLENDQSNLFNIE